MLHADTERLVHRIYEAAVVLELWPEVLDGLAAVCDSFGGTLIAIDPQRDAKFVASAPMQPVMEAFIRGGWNKSNVRFERLMPLQYAGFAQDIDVVTEDEMRENPFYTEFLYPAGGGWAAGTIVAAPSGDHLVFNLERRRATGPFDRATLDRLDALRPHLARASLISGRLRLERAKAMTQALEAIGLPAAVLRSRGSPLAANPGFEALTPHVLQDRRERITLCDSDADGLLQQALEARHHRSGLTRSVPVSARADHPPLIVHLVPIVGAAHDIFAAAAWLLVVTPVDRAAVPGAEVLQGLFDLTPAEARVARGIADAQTIDTIAAAGGVSRETIRSQLRGVLAKTGLNRQAELAALLSGMTRIGKR